MSAALLFCLALGLHAQPRESDPPVSDSDIGAVETHTEIVHYDVEGQTASALGRSLAERGPNVDGKRFFGMTTWEVSAEYRWVERETGCSVDGIVVRVAVETHLPRWRAPSGTSHDVLGAWNRFTAALDHHEHGHRRLAEEAANAMRWRLVSLRAPSCGQIKAVAQREVSSVLSEYDARNRAYDVETGHGRTQDAVWPPRHRIAASD